MSVFQNAAVFHGGSRRFKSVNVQATDDTVSVLNAQTGQVMTSYTIVDTAKVDESTGAWDAYENGLELKTPTKLVVQLGCGCSGMRPWTPDQAYIDRQTAAIEARRQN